MRQLGAFLLLRTGLMRALMGSVTEHVVRRASSPVLVVKQPRLAAAGEQGITTADEQP